MEAREGFEWRISELMVKAANTIKELGDKVVELHNRIKEIETRQDMMWKILQEMTQYLSKEAGERAPERE